MPSYTHSEIIPLSQCLLYEIITDVEKYPSFLPWCLTSTILEASETHLLADLCVGISSFKGTFRSSVKLSPFSMVEVQSGLSSKNLSSLLTPLQHLYTRWHLEEVSPSETRINFYIDFSFRSWLFNKMMDGVFEHATHTMIQAFKKRSHTYGQHCFSS